MRLAGLLPLLLPLMASTVGAEPGRGFERTRIPVEVVVAQPRTISRTMVLTGDVLPIEKLGLCFKIGGRIARVLVDEGDRVTKGQLVAELDTTDYALTRKLAQAQIEALEPHLARARALERDEVLPEAKVQELEGKMHLAKVQLERATAQLTYARLRSPMDGLVVRRMVTAGDMVGPSRPVVAIVDLSRVEVVLPLAQAHVSLVEVGQRVRVTAPGVPGEFTGEITRVGYAADPKTRTFPVTVEVPNPEARLRAGMLARVHVELAPVTGMFLPIEAIRGTSDHRPGVLVVQGGAAVMRPVALGGMVQGLVRVTEGLEPGAEVVYKGLVSDGDAVVVVSRVGPGGTDEPRAVPPAADRDQGSAP